MTDVLGLIPARGGSKGVPRKNVRLLSGKPLIAWSIEGAFQSEALTEIVVSTDDPEIASVAASFGASVPFMRPASLGRDDAPVIPTVLHAADAFPDVEWILLLQPTSPMRSPFDIAAIIAECMEAGAPAAVSTVLNPHPPQWSFSRSPEGMFEVRDSTEVEVQRQELNARYSLKSGGLYLAKVDWLRMHQKYITPETYMYVMPPERSIDIDTELDWQIAEALMDIAIG